MSYSLRLIKRTTYALNAMQLVKTCSCDCILVITFLNFIKWNKRIGL
jgi:hypothetical protein